VLVRGAEAIHLLMFLSTQSVPVPCVIIDCVSQHSFRPLVFHAMVSHAIAHSSHALQHTMQTTNLM